MMFKSRARFQSRLYSDEDFYKSFHHDIQCAKRSVIIESPFITNRRVMELLPDLIRLQKKGVKVVVNTKDPREYQSQMFGSAHKAILAMQSGGIFLLYTVGHHRKIAIIDNDILWEGSLDILSRSDSCEIMRHIDSSLEVNQMLNFTGLAKFIR